MEGTIIKAENLPIGEKIYLKKSSFFGWKVVNPIKNEDGSMNWFNFFVGGNWWNLILVAITVLIILGVLYEYSSNIQHFLDCFSSPQQLEICKNLYGG